MPRVARLRDDMLEFAEAPRNAMIIDKEGKPIGDADRKFFEASWMHKYKGKYYFSYSTGGTHFIAYATGDSPYGPFTHQGNVLLPVPGWTTHHSMRGDRRTVVAVLCGHATRQQNLAAEREGDRTVLQPRRHHSSDRPIRE